MPQVEPNFKESQYGICPCGCETYARYRTTAWRDGLGPHVRTCPCRRCVGGRQRPKARRRENRIAKDTQGHRELLSGGVTGRDVTTGDGVWIEETSNVTVVRGIRRWWESKTVRSKTHRILHQYQAPAALIVSWDGKPQLVVQTYQDWLTSTSNG